MGLTNENVGPKILAKIKIYVLTRAELLFKVCYEIPCICEWISFVVMEDALRGNSLNLLHKFGNTLSLLCK